MATVKTKAKKDSNQSRDAGKFVVRLGELRDSVHEKAKAANVSMNTFIVNLVANDLGIEADAEGNLITTPHLTPGATPFSVGQLVRNKKSPGQLFVVKNFVVKPGITAKAKKEGVTRELVQAQGIDITTLKSVSVALSDLQVV